MHEHYFPCTNFSVRYSWAEKLNIEIYEDSTDQSSKECYSLSVDQQWGTHEGFKLFSFPSNIES